MSRAVMQQALEAIESDTVKFSAWTEKMLAAANALRAALAEPEQEPIGYWDGKFSPDGGATLYEVPQVSFFGRKYPNIPVYAAPTPRKPLTDEEIWNTYKNLWMFHPAEEPRLAGDVLKFARAIERAHGIGEQT